jgi:hypothetical protein
MMLLELCLTVFHRLNVKLKHRFCILSVAKHLITAQCVPQVAILFALVASAIAAPRLVFNPSTVAHGPIVYSSSGTSNPHFFPSFVASTGVVPSTYSSFKGTYASSPVGTFIAGTGPIPGAPASPITYTVDNTAPITYAAGNFAPIPYSAGVAPVGVFPKTIQKNEGASLVTY